MVYIIHLPNRFFSNATGLTFKAYCGKLLNHYPIPTRDFRIFFSDAILKLR